MAPVDDKRAARIVLVGAGSLGRELMAWLRTSGYEGKVAFLDDVTAASRTLPVLGKIEEIDFLLDPDDCILITQARPLDRENLTCRLAAKWPPTMFVHRSAVIAPGVRLQSGSMILPFALISTDTQTGRSLLMNTGASVGHDVVLGNFCTLCSNVLLTGRVEVGDRVFFGSSAVVLPGVKIGSDAFIGAGSVVVRDVPAGTKVFGNPARVLSKGG